jgi:TetR/AcrR family fatty acid metabolism transcriptional regulator
VLDRLANECGLNRVAGLDVFRSLPGGRGQTLKRRGSSSEEAEEVAAQPASEKYQRILEAAVEVIAERGYFNSPVSAIAARAGVADGTIYLYFKSKDEVLRTAIDQVFGSFLDRLEKECRLLTDAREQLECIARLHLGIVKVNRNVAVLMQTEVRQSAKFIAEFSHHHLVRYIQIVREVVRRGQQDGVFRADVSDGVVAHCLFGAIDELLSSAVFTGREYDAQATAAQVVDVVLHGIGTKIVLV